LADTTQPRCRHLGALAPCADSRFVPPAR